MTWWNALALAACVGYIVSSLIPAHAQIKCGDGSMGGAQCVTIVDPYDGSKIEIGCRAGEKCPDWPEDMWSDNDRMMWIGGCSTSDPAFFHDNCPVYINVIWKKP